MFTPEKANKVLSKVQVLVAKIVELKKDIDTSAEGRERSKLVDALRVNISKLEEQGIELKDMDLGLVDFPAMRYDEHVCLCWKLGEHEVSYWHTLNEGYRGRKPLKPEMTQVR